MESLVMSHWKFCKYCGNPIKINQIETEFFNTESGVKEIISEAYCRNNKCPTANSKFLINKDKDRCRGTARSLIIN